MHQNNPPPKTTSLERCLSTPTLQLLANSLGTHHDAHPCLEHTYQNKRPPQTVLNLQLPLFNYIHQHTLPLLFKPHPHPLRLHSQQDKTQYAPLLLHSITKSPSLLRLLLSPNPTHPLLQHHQKAPPPRPNDNTKHPTVWQRPFGDSGQSTSSAKHIHPAVVGPPDW